MVERSETSRKAVLDATLRLLGVVGPGPGTNVQKLSIEAIARESGVSKATIYRWWTSKADVVFEAFVTDYLRHTVVRDDVPAIDALREHVHSVVDQYAGQEGRIVAQMIAEGQYDPAVLAQFMDGFWRGRRAVVVSLLERAQAEGSIRPDVDPALVATLVYAPIYQRLLLRDAPLDPSFADQIVDLALAGAARSGPQQ